MDLDFDFVDVDLDGCGPDAFGFLVFIGIISAVVVGGITVLSEHPIFGAAAAFLFLTVLFGAPRKKDSSRYVKFQVPGEKPKRRSKWRFYIAMISFIAFLACSTVGIREYQIAAQERRIQEAEAQAEQEKIDAENRRLGAWGRLKRWAAGDKDAEKTE